MRKLLFCGLILGFSVLGWAMGLAQDKPAKPEPDVLVFTNGDTLKGTFVRGMEQSVVFKSDMVGEVTVPFDKIKELHTAANFAVLRKDELKANKAVQPGKITVADGAVTVTSPADNGVKVPPTDIGLILDQATYEHDLLKKPTLLQGWNGSVAGGATIIRSTQNSSSYTLGIGLVRSLPVIAYLPRRNRTTIDFTDTYGKLTQPFIAVTNTPFSEIKTSIYHADAEQDEYFSQRFYALALTSFDHNFSQGLDLQQIYGGGFGWTPIQTPIQQLDLKADVHYEKQSFDQTLSASPSQNLIGSTFSEAYRRNLPGKLVLTENASILPAWNNTNAYSAFGTATLALPVYHRLSVALTTTDNFINNPALGFKKNSFQFVTGVTYTLH